MFKKILFSFTTLLAVGSLSLAGGESVSAAVEGDYEYRIVGDAAEITKYNGPGGDLIIPGELGGIPVKSIKSMVFGSKKLTSVVIPEGVTTIGGIAFMGNQITSVTLPESITTIENAAFRNNRLTSVIIPKGLTTINGSVFDNNLLTSVVIPEGVTTIGSAAFGGNELTSIILPDSVTTIESSAFSNNQLTSVVFPEGLTTIGENAFYMNSLTSVIIPKSATTLHNRAFFVNPSGLVIKGYAGSTAEVHAIANGYIFEDLTPPPVLSALIPTTVKVVPGTLTFANELVSIYADQVSLNGQNQTLTASFNDTLDVIDARGAHTGYDIQVSLTDLVSGANVITKDNITLKGLNTISADGVSGPVENISGASDFSLINLGTGQGIGQHTLDFSNAEMDVFISDKTKSGIYDGTMTLSLVTTP